jgi:mycothiol synthase
MNQLEMLLKPDTFIPADYDALDPTYRIRTYQDGDDTGYILLMRQAGFEDWQEKNLHDVLSHALPNGLFFIEHHPTNLLVATTVALHRPSVRHPFGGELGWVAADSNHKGKRLGLYVVSKVSERLLQGGYEQIYLLTDDWRLPAIKIYLDLGWIPHIYDADMEDRWLTVYEELKRPIESQKWVVTPWKLDETSAERRDQDSLKRYPPRFQWYPDRIHRGFSCDGDVDAFGDESLYHGSQVGTMTCTPTTVKAGAIEPLEIMFTCGSYEISEHGRITFVVRGQDPLGMIALQGDDSTVLEAPEGVELKRNYFYSYEVVKGSMRSGDVLKFRIPMYWTPLAHRIEIKTSIQYFKDKPEQRLPEPAVIQVQPLEPNCIDITLPCTQGRRHHGLLTIRDKFDNRVCDFHGPVLLHFGEEKSEIPVTDGRSVLSILKDKKTFHLEVSIPKMNLSGKSNYCVPAFPPPQHYFIGDLHAHCFMSEAEGYTDEVYTWARDERFLDFVSISQQAHGYLDNETWTVAKYMNERYLDEGRFVTFLGFEWQHTGYGDKIIHYLNGDQPYLLPSDERYNTPSKLYQALRESDAFIVSHHPGYHLDNWVPGTDADAMETDVDRLMELWSMHGSSEGYDLGDRPLVQFDENNMVMQALRKGVRVGFTAGSDTHSARPGGSHKEPRRYFGGLVAVWADDLTRRNIHQALYNRQTVALTGARIVLRMTINDAMQGAELSFTTYNRITIFVQGTAPIKEIELLKNTEDFKCLQGSELIKHTVSEYQVRWSLDVALDAPAFFHCRVTQEDGHLAVCSPIWIG